MDDRMKIGSNSTRTTEKKWANVIESSHSTNQRPDADEARNMATRSVVADDHHRHKAAELVAADDEAASGGAYFESLFDSGNDRGHVAGAERTVDEDEEAYRPAEPLDAQPGVGISYPRLEHRRRRPQRPRRLHRRAHRNEMRLFRPECHLQFNFYIFVPSHTSDLYSGVALFWPWLREIEHALSRERW